MSFDLTQESKFIRVRYGITSSCGQRRAGRIRIVPAHLEHGVLHLA
jgi:hypothetical protein